MVLESEEESELISTQQEDENKVCLFNRYILSTINNIQYQDVRTFLIFKQSDLKEKQNAYCKQCNIYFTAHKQKDGSMKKTHYRQHLRSHHMKHSSPTRKRFKQLSLKEMMVMDQYRLARESLLKSVVLNYMPFASVEYHCVKNQFLLIGCHPPGATTISDDLNACCKLAEDQLVQILSKTNVYSIIFDLWSSLCKDSILSVIFNGVVDGEYK